MPRSLGQEVVGEGGEEGEKVDREGVIAFESPGKGKFTATVMSQVSLSLSTGPDRCD